MEPYQPTQRPRLRTTGGIVIGQRGRMPMAITDDPVRRFSRSPSFSYTGHQIWGFPWKNGASFSVGPVVGPRGRQLSDEWVGTIPSGGCQFWLTEVYDEDIILVDGLYYRSGHVSPVSTSISQAAFSNAVDPSIPSAWGGSGDAGPSQVTAAWLLSVVKEDNGAYYLCTDVGAPGFPRLGLPSPMPVYPDDFDITNPL